MTRNIVNFKRPLTLLGIGLILVFLVACASQAPTPTGNAEAAENQPSATVPGAIGPNSQPSIVSVPTVQGDARFSSQVIPGNGTVAGISVSGQGQASRVPNLATLNLGVEAFRDTVQAARDDAANAMEGVIDVLKNRGIENRDIQTRFFNINPRFERNGQNIVGFQVSNQLTVKIRNLDNVGTIIDEVTRAGGDLTRFQGINFSIEDTKPLEEQARAAAVADMTAKANQLAQLTGVQLGQPYSITETGGFSPIRAASLDRAFFSAEAAAPTQILAGEVDVTVTLQAMYAVQ